MTDTELMERRIRAIEAACTAAERVDSLSNWAVAVDATVTLNTRRVRELLELARVGLEKMKED